MSPVIERVRTHRPPVDNMGVEGVLSCLQIFHGRLQKLQTLNLKTVSLGKMTKL